MEWDDHGKVRQATAQAPDDEVPPPPRGRNCLRLAARAPHAPEAAWEALHYALYWAQGAPEAPPPRNALQRGHATPPATRPTCAATEQAPGTGSSPGPRTRLTPCRRPRKCLAS